MQKTINKRSEYRSMKPFQNNIDQNELANAKLTAKDITEIEEQIKLMANMKTNSPLSK